MKYLLLSLFSWLHFFSFSQTLKMKIIDEVYTNSIIELTYVNGSPNGEYFCWFLDGQLKEKGVIDNSKINTENIDNRHTNIAAYVDSFYKAQNHKNYIDAKTNVFSTITGNNHRHISLYSFNDTLNKVVYDYYNSFKTVREKHLKNKEKSQIVSKEYFKVYENKEHLFIPAIDTMFSYSENGKLSYKIVSVLISTFKSSKVWNEKIISYDYKNRVISEDNRYYETKNDILRDVTITKNISYLNGKKIIIYYIVDSWNNKIKI